jgi:hypothetical protein
MAGWSVVMARVVIAAGGRRPFAYNIFAIGIMALSGPGRSRRR